MKQRSIVLAVGAVIAIGAIVVLFAVPYFTTKSSEKKSQAQSTAELLEEVAKSEWFQNELRRGREQKARYDEESFKITYAHFTPDERALIFQTSDSKLRSLDVQSRQMTTLSHGEGLGIGRISPDGRYGIESDRITIRDTSNGTKYKLGREPSFCGFGYGPSTVLYFDTVPYLDKQTNTLMSSKNYVFKDFVNDQTFWQIPEPQETGWSPICYWLDSGKKVFVTSKIHRLIDVEKGEFMPLSLPLTYARKVVEDDQHLGFVYAGRDYGTPAITPFWYDFRTRKATPLAFDSIPISFSLTVDRLWVKPDGESVQELKISEGFNPVWQEKLGYGEIQKPAGSPWLFIIGREKQVQALHLETKEKKLIGQITENGVASGSGIFISSPSGKYVVRSRHRDIQVLMPEQLNKEIPQYITVKIPRE